MKIIIELDSSNEQQPEIKRVTSTQPEQQVNVNTAALFATSGIDAGHARMPDGYGQDSSGTTLSQQTQGAASFSASGVLDAGPAKIQDQSVPAFAMPDTGNMETINQGNTFSAGAFSNTVNN